MLMLRTNNDHENYIEKQTRFAKFNVLDVQISTNAA